LIPGLPTAISSSGEDEEEELVIEELIVIMEEDIEEEDLELPRAEEEELLGARRHVLAVRPLHTGRLATPSSFLPL
jgi:hypothetical protein